MTAYLPDVNVLIALLDPLHVHHEHAHTWFGGLGRKRWLSSPTTQNGVLRIVSHPRYANHSPVSAVVDALRSLLETPNHSFVPDSISLVEQYGGPLLPGPIATTGQVTDTYLVLLAAANEATLATFDKKLYTGHVVNGSSYVHLLL